MTSNPVTFPPHDDITTLIEAQQALQGRGFLYLAGLVNQAREAIARFHTGQLTDGRTGSEMLADAMAIRMLGTGINLGMVEQQLDKKTAQALRGIFTGKDNTAAQSLHHLEEEGIGLRKDVYSPLRILVTQLSAYPSKDYPTPQLGSSEQRTLFESVNHLSNAIQAFITGNFLHDMSPCSPPEGLRLSLNLIGTQHFNSLMVEVLGPIEAFHVGQYLQQLKPALGQFLELQQLPCLATTAQTEFLRSGGASVTRHG